jgi:CHAD domain-containing protein
MSYQLDLDVEVPDAVRAAIVEQLDDAANALTERRAEDAVKAIHEARKDFKKARSALRLAREASKPKHRKGINEQLRAIAAQLSDVRDADVMVETVQALGERYAGQLPRRQFTTVTNRFVKAAQASRATADAAISDALLDELAAVREDVLRWRLKGCPHATLASGAAIAYERGRDALTDALDDATTDSLHEWRKRVKDLWYHARLLNNAWPAVLSALADEAHALSDLLGDEHDLGVLTARLGDHQWPPSVDVDRLQQLVSNRRDELRAGAWSLGRRVYAEKPKAFEKRLSAYLE